MQERLALGIDIGSISIKTALVDEQARLIIDTYTRIKGDPVSALKSELALIETRFPGAVSRAAVTGSGGKQIADRIGAHFVNEVLAQARFAGFFHPRSRTIIEMGGEDAKLITLGRDEAADREIIEDFSMNTACAAGTGSFLDQQASRLRLSIEEFSEAALESKNPPRVAGRCSVFAKSDMIHLQQIATPAYDIVAGLCYAMARNFKATVGKGKKILSPVLFLGGVAANLGMRRAMQDVLHLAVEDFITPPHFFTSGAIGAALTARERSEAMPAYRGAGELRLRPYSIRKSGDEGPRQLVMPAGVMQEEMPDPRKNTAVIEAFLGIDVGSVSTNVVVIDSEGRVLSKRYLPTAGRPIEAVKQGLAEVGAEVGDRVVIRGAGTTGSGRYLTGDMIGADVIRNEITAQATAAAAIDSSVDTIFEIGGQDSKYISLQNGAVVDFEMNKACAAGTGSFLEEQAERLGISIRKEFESRAFQAASPCGLGERCTVFIESDLVHSLNTGMGVEEVTAGLAYSIAHNYLNKVVAGKKVGNRIFFQGGVAANKAVVSAFEIVTGKAVTVPPHHEVTGAIGAALLAQRARGEGPSGFKGFDLSKRAYSISSFECVECANRCDIRKVSFDGEKPLFYGSRCEKYDVKKHSGSAAREGADLFVERERMLTAGIFSGQENLPTIGIPRALFLHDFLPFWRTFFSELGYRVVLSDRTNRGIINKGLEAATAETCFPARVALGHIQDLIDKQVDILFLPSFVSLASDHTPDQAAQPCPYVQSLPYVARASLALKGVSTLEPVLYMHDDKSRMESTGAVGELLGKGRTEIRTARDLAEHAQSEFVRAIEQKGKDFLSSLDPAEKVFVLIGRSYNTCDAGLNMNLPGKMRDLGVKAIPMDALPLGEVDLQGWSDMYWRSGQRILAAARLIKERPNLCPVYITNFGCGPDSFITHFFHEEMGGKPFLQLEIDEHSADAGAITRIEAFLDSLGGDTGSRKPRVKVSVPVNDLKKRTVYFPPMSDHAHALAAAFRSCGVNAVVLPESDSETVRIGKEYSSGRECYPLALTVGDMIKAARTPGFDPDRSAFFMPGGRGPCRFGQYQRYHRQVLDGIGMEKVPIFSPMQDETMYQDLRMLDKNFVRMCWQGVLAVDLIMKALHEIRPYEQTQGQADGVYRASLDRISCAVEKREDLLPILEKSYQDFMRIATSARTKPVIGIVGEIYIRSNRFSNEDLVRRIESLGGEAWVAPVSEWLLYLTETSKTSARMSRSWKALFTAYLTGWVQHRDELRLLSGFNGTLRSLHEPAIPLTLEYAKPYIHDSFEGEAVLSVGKAVDFIKKGVSGIISVMPLTCMPGTIASAILKRVHEDHGRIPLLNIAYEGQQDSQTVTRLEAFMHQARTCGKTG